jgi:hypothetical protein
LIVSSDWLKELLKSLVVNSKRTIFSKGYSNSTYLFFLSKVPAAAPADLSPDLLLLVNPPKLLLDEELLLESFLSLNSR